MITVEKTHLKRVILFYSKIPVQIHKTMLFCSHLNLKPPPLPKFFSQGYAFHLGNYLSITAPDPFNAKANEKGPRTRPWCTPKKSILTTKSVHCLSVFSGDFGSPCLLRRTKNLSLHRQKERETVRKHKETQQDRCERKCVRVHPQLHVLVHLL